MKLLQIFFFALLLGVGGCSPADIGLTRILLDKEVYTLGQSWEPQIRRRYPNAVVVYSHGVSVADRWWIRTNRGVIPAFTLVEVVRSAYPDRRIVLLVCNPGGHKLEFPNVSYALRDVWIVPDSSAGRENTETDSGVGAFTEFVHNE